MSATPLGEHNENRGVTPAAKVPSWAMQMVKGAAPNPGHVIIAYDEKIVLFDGSAPSHVKDRPTAAQLEAERVRGLFFDGIDESFGGDAIGVYEVEHEGDTYTILRLDQMRELEMRKLFDFAKPRQFAQAKWVSCVYKTLLEAGEVSLKKSLKKSLSFAVIAFALSAAPSDRTKATVQKLAKEAEHIFPAGMAPEAIESVLEKLGFVDEANRRKTARALTAKIAEEAAVRAAEDGKLQAAIAEEIDQRKRAEDKLRADMSQAFGGLKGDFEAVRESADAAGNTAATAAAAAAEVQTLIEALEMQMQSLQESHEASGLAATEAARVAAAHKAQLEAAERKAAQDAAAAAQEKELLEQRIADVAKQLQAAADVAQAAQATAVGASTAADAAQATADGASAAAGSALVNALAAGVEAGAATKKAETAAANTSSLRKQVNGQTKVTDAVLKAADNRFDKVEAKTDQLESTATARGKQVTQLVDSTLSMSATVNDLAKVTKQVADVVFATKPDWTLLEAIKTELEMPEGETKKHRIVKMALERCGLKPAVTIAEDVQNIANFLEVAAPTETSDV